jgi:hypothetical protein
MNPGRPIDTPTDAPVLKSGENRVTFSAGTVEGYPDDINVLFYRLGPMTP